MVDGIENGKSPDTFITEKWGETWVMLLRLLVGSQATNRKISIEEFDTFQTISFGKSSGLENESMTIFQRKGRKGKLTPVGMLLINKALFQLGQETQRENLKLKCKIRRSHKVSDVYK